MFFLTFAWVVAFLSGVFAAVVGLVALAKGSTWHGLFGLLVAAPVAFGHYIALGLAMNYAERRP